MARRRKKLHRTIGRRPPLFELTAGVLCLDFVNTLDNRPTGEPKELLARYGDLVRFAEDTGILTLAQADRLFVWRGVLRRAGFAASRRSCQHPLTTSSNARTIGSCSRERR